ncbi:MAG TPA: hypothetical protein VI457_16345 [Methylococcaceae bacterium]|nr:hypothetical protein [Methylococcaceae bacterium]
MKLWYAFLFPEDDAPDGADDIGYIVRAATPVRCAVLIELMVGELPEYMQKFVTGAIELGDDIKSNEERILCGPLKGAALFNLDEHQTYWRRDYPGDDWVNINLLHAGRPYPACVFNELAGGCGEEQTAPFALKND